MKILIAGASSIGSMFSSYLSASGYEVTVIDKDNNKLIELDKNLEILPVTGDACIPSTLIEANIEDINLLLATTNNDYANLFICHMAKSLFNVKKTVTKLEISNFNKYPELFNDKVFHIDGIICSKIVIGQHIHELLKHPYSSDVFSFSNSLFKMIQIRVLSKSLACGKSIEFILNHLARYKINIFAIFRANKLIKTTKDTVIEIADELFFISHNRFILDIIKFFYGDKPLIKKIIIAGFNEFSFELAKMIEYEYDTKLIEKDSSKSLLAQEHLKNTLVINSNITNINVLKNEDIDQSDILITITDKDEINLITSMLAKQLGANYTMAFTTKQEYITFQLYKDCNIDINIYMPQIIINNLFPYLTTDYVKNRYLFKDDLHTLVEVLIDNNHESLVGEILSEINLPSYATIIAIFFEDQSLELTEDTIISAGCKIAFLLSDKKYYLDFENLFY